MCALWQMGTITFGKTHICEHKISIQAGLYSNPSNTRVAKTVRYTVNNNKCEHIQITKRKWKCQWFHKSRSNDY